MRILGKWSCFPSSAATCNGGTFDIFPRQKLPVVKIPDALSVSQRNLLIYTQEKKKILTELSIFHPNRFCFCFLSTFFSSSELADLETPLPLSLSPLPSPPPPPCLFANVHPYTPVVVDDVNVVLLSSSSSLLVLSSSLSLGSLAVSATCWLFVLGHKY